MARSATVTAMLRIIQVRLGADALAFATGFTIGAGNVLIAAVPGIELEVAPIVLARCPARALAFGACAETVDARPRSGTAGSFIGAALAGEPALTRADHGLFEPCVT